MRSSGFSLLLRKRVGGHRIPRWPGTAHDSLIPYPISRTGGNAMGLSNTPAPPDHGTGPYGPDGPAAALAEPTRKVTPRWVAGLVLVNVGINAAFFGPLNIFIGQQAISIDEPSKEAILSLATACG